MDRAKEPITSEAEIPETLPDDLGVPLLDDGLPSESGGEPVPPVPPVHPKPNPRTSRSAQSVLVKLAVEAALDSNDRRKLPGEKALAVVVSVPSAAWIVPVTKHFKFAFGRAWQVYARDGSSRTRDKASVGNEEVAADLSLGRSIVGIAVDPKAILPTALNAAADIRIGIGQPSGHLVRRVIRACTFGAAVPELSDEAVADLDIDDIVAALRPDTTARSMVRRLRAASKVRAGRAGDERLPVLETAFEYGEARAWGLDLAKDLNEYCANRLQWRDVDKGAVFYSKSPGTGKSLLARIIARSCGIPIVTGSMGEIFASSSGDLGGVIKAQREMFARAAALAGSAREGVRHRAAILFLDEIDGLPSRESLNSQGSGNALSWWMPVVEDFMMLLDSAMSQREGIVVLGATNRISAVDPAILRPGRLERAIEIELPHEDGILNIMRYQLEDSLREVDLAPVARILVGRTGAEIMETVRAARRLARNAGRAMTFDDLMTTLVPKHEMPPDMLFRVTIHEAAHAVIALEIPAGTVPMVRLNAKGASPGQTDVVFDESDLLTRESIEDRVTVLLSGRAAERIFTGAESLGSAGVDRSDLSRATAMIAALYVSDGLGGSLVYLRRHTKAIDQLRRDPVLRRRVDRHLHDLQERADGLVERHRASILAVARALAEKGHLSGHDIAEILQAARVADPGPSAKAARPARGPGRRKISH